MAVRTLDFGDPDPFAAVIGEPRHLLWPVHAYRVTIPVLSDSESKGLNAFERVIVGVLTAAGTMDETRLSDETCIPVDLVRNVLLRLRDRDILDASNRVIATARSGQRDERSTPSYRTAFIFQERVEGRVLPFLRALDRDGSATTKEVKRATTKRVRPGKPGTHRAPTARDVVNAATEMRRRAVAWGSNIQVLATAQVRVLPDPEEYLLDCPIAILTDGDFRIADPFGVGYSRLFEELFSGLLETDANWQEWEMQWRSSLSVEHSREATDGGPAHPFDTPANRLRYPRLVHHLTPGWPRHHRSLTQVYAALEWALFYCADDRDAQTTIRLIRAQDSLNYSTWLSDIASILGLDTPRTGFRPLPRGKLDDFLAGKAEMETVLAINVVQASLHRDHPLHTIVHTHPDFVAQLRSLTQSRGNHAHGNAAQSHDDVGVKSDPFMRACVEILLPTVTFSGASTRSTNDSLADLRLDARTTLLGRFGRADFNRLGANVQAALIDAEQAWMTFQEEDDALEYVTHTYAALQGSIAAWVNSLPDNRSLPESPSHVAAKNTEAAGLGPLPPNLTQVNERRVREAVQGNHLSLGASIVALLALADPGSLGTIATAQPDFVATIAEITRRRGHGNEPVPMQRAELEKLRASVLTTIATTLDHNQRN